jgi:flagellar assembly protein FliH
MPVIKRDQWDNTVMAKSPSALSSPISTPQQNSQRNSMPLLPNGNPEDGNDGYAVAECSSDEASAFVVSNESNEAESVHVMSSVLAQPPTEETVASGFDQNDPGSERRGVGKYRRVEEKELISRAMQDAEHIREQAHQSGYQDGMQAGFNQAFAELESLQSTLSQLLSGKEDALQSVAKDIASLAIQVAEQIIKTEVSCDETLVFALVQDVIQKAGRNVKSMLLRINPQQANDLKLAIKQGDNGPMGGIIGHNVDVQVVAEPTVEYGSCIVETNSGMIDARFSTQITTLKKLLGVQDTLAVSLAKDEATPLALPDLSAHNA